MKKIMNAPVLAPEKVLEDVFKGMAGIDWRGCKNKEAK